MTAVHEPTAAQQMIARTVLVVVLFVLLIVNVAILMMANQTQQSAQKLVDTVADCQNPSGACYAKNQQRLTDFARQMAYLTQCAKYTATAEQLDACVRQRTGAFPAGPTLTPSPAPSPSR